MTKEESTWDEVVVLQKHFPHLNLEGKIHVREEGYDKPKKKRDSRSLVFIFQFLKNQLLVPIS